MVVMGGGHSTFGKAGRLPKVSSCRPRRPSLNKEVVVNVCSFLQAADRHNASSTRAQRVDEWDKDGVRDVTISHPSFKKAATAQEPVKGHNGPSSESRCVFTVDETSFFGVVDILSRQQSQWESSNPQEWVRGYYCLTLHFCGSTKPDCDGWAQ